MNALVRKRMERCPKDRIAFLRTTYAADLDKKAFCDYLHGSISLKTMCERLASNNNLPYVTEEQALNELRICGYEG